MKAIYIDERIHRKWKLAAAAQGVPLRSLIERHLRAALDGLENSSGTSDVTTREVTAAAAGGGAFAFWDREEADLYLPTDGKPVR